MMKNKLSAFLFILTLFFSVIALPSLYNAAMAADSGQQANLDAGEDDDGKNELCGLALMKSYYLNESDVESSCWYCKIVIVMTNAYFEATSSALSVSIDLGRLILKLGFMIWLAFFILQQVSSIEAITPGKMLQEILTMGFRVALAWLFIEQGTAAISTYLLDPLLGFGTDYGIALLEGMRYGR